ncbi:alpha/beta hydrolase family protein [Lacrimispora sp.]|uniref:alpha/beta hydrolase family protein n=1 Tax=Lacrimispora sp. TaxID=2719234 RepID=UPI0028643AE3|nr:alpha/beta hydrolase family protein [Lacrimispora sp.]MDR7813940.1 alpha/beta hydrolase family protein [Lacrimispora sp.]
MADKMVYYTSLHRLSAIFRNNKPRMAMHADNQKEFEEWQKETRKKLKILLGMNKLEECPLKPQLMEREEEENFYRTRMLIQTDIDVWMPFFILEPKGREGEKLPSVIAAHGHDSGGKAVIAGKWDRSGVKKAAEQYHYTYGLEMVRRGYRVYCPDARGFGERRERSGQGDTIKQYMSSTCRELNQMAISLGLSLTGLWVWDLMRLTDYITKREDNIPGKIGCMGLSGGGLQTLWLAALEERIQAAVVSGYFYGYHDALLIDNINCNCNYVPHLWEHADMGDIGALVAPRGLLIETGSEDPLNGEGGLQNVQAQLETVKKAYTLSEAEDNLSHHIFSGSHRWSGETAYDFMDRYLK